MKKRFQIQTKRIEKGRYLIARSDGREFVALRCGMPLPNGNTWILEAQDNYSLDDFGTLSAIKYAIAQCWTSELKKIGKQTI